MTLFALKNVSKMSSNCKRLLSMKSEIKTAGIVVIGDEVLKGDVIDTNSNYASAKLYKLGIKVKKITVIGDDVDQIGSEVLDYSKKYDYVITSGGIGPTHDDVTLEAVAKAFNEPLIVHPVLKTICCNHFKTTDLNPAGLKMSQVPKSAALTFVDDKTTGRKAPYPNISLGNIYMFPGIPHLFRKAVDALGEKFSTSSNTFHTRTIYFNVTEDMIVSALARLVKEFPNALFGSYPELFNNTYKVKVTIESTDENIAIAAYMKLLELVPKEFIVPHGKL